MQSIIDALARACLQQNQMVRALAATSWATYLGPADYPPVQRGVEAGRRYAEAVQAAGAGHPHGPPHPHVLLATLEAMVPPDNNDPDRPVLTAAVQNLQQMTIDQVAIAIPYFRLVPTYPKENQPAKIRLMINVSPWYETT